MLRSVDEPLTDSFRWCVYCDADCYADEPDHAADCPSLTGVRPIRESELHRCPHCGEPTHETACMDCGVPLGVGDCYVLRDAETGEIGGRPMIGEVICVGCAARLGLTL